MSRFVVRCLIASLLLFNGLASATSVSRALHTFEGFGVTTADFRSSATRLRTVPAAVPNISSPIFAPATPYTGDAPALVAETSQPVPTFRFQTTDTYVVTVASVDIPGAFRSRAPPPDA